MFRVIFKEHASVQGVQLSALWVRSLALDALQLTRRFFLLYMFCLRFRFFPGYFHLPGQHASTVLVLYKKILYKIRFDQRLGFHLVVKELGLVQDRVSAGTTGLVQDQICLFASSQAPLVVD